jgi:L-threonylcarbamoyladenylate synthase
VQADVVRAARIIRAGGVVAFPTESFYGLAVDATNESAIHRLFDIKNRAIDQPVLILIPNVDVLDRYAVKITSTARRLMACFWPGGLTLVLEAAASVSPLLTAGTGHIGVRWSSHHLATELTRTVGRPITGTSANLSGQPGCRSAAEVSRVLTSKLDFVLDGGGTKGGPGSTVLDVTIDPPVILREGMISRLELRGFLG